MNPNRNLHTTFFKLTTLYALIFSASSLIVFGIIYWIASGTFEQQMNLSVKGEFSVLEQEYQIGEEKELMQEIRQRITSGTHGFSYYLLQDSKGEKLAGNLPATKEFEGWREIIAPYPVVLGKNDLDFKETQSHKALVMGKRLSDGAFLVVGVSTFRKEELREAIRVAFLWATGVILVLSFVGGAILSAGFLRRIDEINRTAKAIINGHLSERVKTLGTDDELDMLAANLNTMLNHIQALMDSLEQISINIAHDLRRPLGRLQQHLETVRQDHSSNDAYKVEIDNALLEVDDILATFGSLIRIAQIEAKTRRFSFNSMDLSSVYQTVVDVYGPVIEEAGKTFEVDITPEIAIDGDRELLTQQMVNLIENAISHTPKNAHIHLSLSQSQQGPVGTLTDNGSGIPRDERDKIFERFYRLEASRTSPGNGLGLALVKAVANLHEATLAVADNHPGAVFTIRYKDINE